MEVRPKPTPRSRLKNQAAPDSASVMVEVYGWRLTLLAQGLPKKGSSTGVDALMLHQGLHELSGKTIDWYLVNADWDVFSV